jgi:hypothetical protein
MNQSDERSQTYQAIEENRDLVDFLVNRFELPPISEIRFNGMDSPFLESPSGDLDSLMEFELTPSLRLVFPDNIGDYWLKKFKNYQVGEFGGIEPRREFMNDPRCEANYRILLGFEIANELVSELRALNIGATIDLRLKVHGSTRRLLNDYSGFTIYPASSVAKVAMGLSAALSLKLLQA